MIQKAENLYFYVVKKFVLFLLVADCQPTIRRLLANQLDLLVDPISMKLLTGNIFCMIISLIQAGLYFASSKMVAHREMGSSQSGNKQDTAEHRKCIFFDLKCIFFDLGIIC